MASSSTKRAWKLQEFVAHGSNVNCLALSHKSGQVMVTGGEDKKVNMWAVGKPNCIMSLSGHTTAVESVRFSNSDDMVVAGSLSGALKIWDLQQAKIVRTLTGHKSCIKGLDFHPYGDFVASGSQDTNIKGHTDCVNSLRFSPDGRWIASAGQDSTFKLWDLTAGKLLHDFKQHEGPVVTVEFHPSELLIASASTDRTIKFWDLQTFQPVCSTDGDSQPIRCIFFHPEGGCIYGGTQDVLRVYGWEPSRSFDSLAIGWGKVADISIAQNQLIGATFSQTNVSMFVVDIQRVQPLGGPPGQIVSPPQQPRVNQSKRTPAKNIPKGNVPCGRRSFTSRPPTQSTKRAEPKIEPEEQTSIEQASVEDPETDSQAEITDPTDYKEIFKPSKDLSHSPPRKMEPFPAPPDDAGSQPPSRLPAAAATPAPDATVVIATKPSAPRVSATTQRTTPAAAPVASQAPAASQGHVPTKLTPQSPKVLPGETRATRAERDTGHRPHTGTRVVSANRDKPAGLDVDDFLPKQASPYIANEAGQHNMSEGEALSSIMKGCDSMSAVMAGRYKNLQIVRALWTGGNMKTALDSAIGMNDRAIIVDLLNVLIQKPGLWSLDICTLMLPQLTDLINSKYENYVQTGCSSLKVILRNFASVIKGNITAPPSLGVDISREERYQKCKSCYKYLMEVRNEIGQKQSHGKNAAMVKELQLLMSQLD